MIAQAPSTRNAYQDKNNNELFLAMLPTIERYAERYFSRRLREQREELVAGSVALAYCMFLRLIERGKADVAYPSPLAMYACRQVLVGRSLGTRLSVRDVMSRHCQKRKGVRIERLDRFDREQGSWREVLVEDRKSTPADIAAARIDIPGFFETLTPRDRRIAENLACGVSTSSVAQQFQLTAARISQLRRELQEKWRQFQGEAVPEACAAPSACQT
jgi:hypothetical protein